MPHPHFTPCRYYCLVGPRFSPLGMSQYWPTITCPMTPPSTSTTPDLFRDQLETIETLDMEVVSLSEKTTQAALEGHQDDRLRVALTFDDAYESVYTKAWPILKERGIPFTVFVMTDAIDDGINGYMNWEQLRELANHELVTIGNHTSDHDSLLRRKGETVEQQTERIAGALDSAAKRLEEELGIQPQLFAHPYGEFSNKVDQSLEARGWYGFAQHSGVLGPASTPTRFHVSRSPTPTEALIPSKQATRPELPGAL